MSCHERACGPLEYFLNPFFLLPIFDTAESTNTRT